VVFLNLSLNLNLAILKMSIANHNSFSLKTICFCVTIFTFKIEDTRVTSVPVTRMKYPIKSCKPSKQGRAEACLKIREVLNESMSRTGRNPVSR
jgi:hypothetical protein